MLPSLAILVHLLTAMKAVSAGFWSARFDGPRDRDRPMPGLNCFLVVLVVLLTAGPAIGAKNSSPSVSLTSPPSGAAYTAPASIALAATASDPGGSVAKVEFFSGTTLLGTATTPPYSSTWSNVPPGSYALTAKATDNLGATKTSTAVTVTVSGPSIVIASPAEGAVTLYDRIDVTGTFQGGADTTVLVNNGAGSSVIATLAGNGFTASSVPLRIGANTLAVVAARRDGTSSSASVRVFKRLQPVVTIIAPDIHVAYQTPINLTLQADAASPGGTMSRVEYYRSNAGVLVGTATVSPYAYVWNNVPAGSHQLVAKAIDDLGNFGWSSPAPISVVGPNIPPTVSLTAPTGNATFTAPANINIQASASDLDGTVATVKFLQGGNVLAVTNTSPFQFTWANVGVGNYTLAASATDDRGGVGNSAPVTVSVTAPNRPPSVALVSPADGAAFSSTDVIQLLANASDPDGTVAKVEFFRGTTLLATATTAPYAGTWSNAPPGTHALTAKATDNLGMSASSAAATISVDSLALAITSPAEGGTIYGNDVVVTGTFSGAAPSGITVNGQGAVLGSGTFAATVPLAAGANAITVTAGTSSGTVSKSIAVTRATPTTTVTNFTSGQTVGDDNVTLRGTVRGPPNSALFVNGQLASVDANGSFFANNVGLAPGDNTLTLTLNTPDAASTQQTFNLRSTGAAPFTVEVSPDRGVAAPLSATLTLTNRGLAAYNRLELDVDGNGTVDYSESGPTTPVPQLAYTLTYSSPGTYPLTLTLRDTAGNVVYAATRVIHVGTASETGVKLRAVYTDMLDQLRAGNIDGAGNAITGTIRDRYRDAFMRLGTTLQQAIAGLGTVREATMTETYGDILVTRDKSDGTYAYHIHVIRDGDGIWRIDGM